MFKSVADNFKQNRKELSRLWVVVAGIYIISLLLGIAIFLIVLGIQFSIRKIFVHWMPARNWLIKTFDLTFQKPDDTKLSSQKKLLVNLFHLAVTLLYITIGFYIINLGIDILSRDGFLGQNLIYQIFFR